MSNPKLLTGWLVSWPNASEPSIRDKAIVVTRNGMEAEEKCAQHFRVTDERRLKISVIPITILK